jgi:hypothetical protein
MRGFVSALWGLLVLLCAADARAHPWMIGEGEPACASCHADPSGAGLLTAYGRGTSATVLSTIDASAHRKAVFGALPEPDWLLYSFAYRGALLATDGEGAPLSARAITMQADLRAQATFLDRVRINGSVGFVPSGGQLAALRADAPLQFVSREHWLGVDLGRRRDVLLRAGRIALPYGMRGAEHPMWVRTATRTDTAFQQQHGVALSRTAARYRSEWMAVLGNYQASPDLYRERGYSGYYEHLVRRDIALGLSSLLTRAQGDLYASRRRAVTRQAHGVFARIVVARPVVLLAQADVVAKRAEAREREVGAVGLVQAQVRLLPGLHLLPAFEAQQLRFDEGGASVGAWLSLLFFPYAHLETRLDLIGRSIDTRAGRVEAATGLFSLHVYL